MQGFLVQCFSCLQLLLLNCSVDSCIHFSLKGSSSTDQPSAVDSILLHSHGACAASAPPVGGTFHLEEQGGIKQDFCQGGNQKQTK